MATVAEMFQQVLGRTPLQGGLDYYTNIFGSDVSAEELAAFQRDQAVMAELARIGYTAPAPSIGGGVYTPTTTGATALPTAAEVAAMQAAAPTGIDAYLQQQQRQREFYAANPNPDGTIYEGPIAGTTAGTTPTFASVLASMDAARAQGRSYEPTEEEYAAYINSPEYAAMLAEQATRYASPEYIALGEPYRASQDALAAQSLAASRALTSGPVGTPAAAVTPAVTPTAPAAPAAPTPQRLSLQNVVPSVLPQNVTGMFQQVLGRAPLQGGLDYYTNLFGPTIEQSEYDAFMADPAALAELARTGYTAPTPTVTPTVTPTGTTTSITNQDPRYGGYGSAWTNPSQTDLNKTIRLLEIKNNREYGYDSRNAAQRDNADWEALGGQTELDRYVSDPGIYNYILQNSQGQGFLGGLLSSTGEFLRDFPTRELALMAAVATGMGALSTAGATGAGGTAGGINTAGLTAEQLAAPAMSAAYTAPTLAPALTAAQAAAIAGAGAGAGAADAALVGQMEALGLSGQAAIDAANAYAAAGYTAETLGAAVTQQAMLNAAGLVGTTGNTALDMQLASAVQTGVMPVSAANAYIGAVQAGTLAATDLAGGIATEYGIGTTPPGYTPPGGPVTPGGAPYIPPGGPVTPGGAQTIPFNWSDPSTYPWGNIFGTGATMLGGYLSGQSATDAAQTAANAQIEAARIAAEAQMLRPMPVQNIYGGFTPTFDAQGRLTGLNTTTAPWLAGQQQQLIGMSGTELQRAQDISAATAPMIPLSQQMFGLSQGYLQTSPQAQAAKYMEEQQALLAPIRERQMAQMLASEQARGTLGLGVGATTTGLGAANPRLEAMLNAQRMQDLGLAAQATQGGMEAAQFGAQMGQAGGQIVGQVGPTAAGGFQAYGTVMRGLEGTQQMAEQPMQTSLQWATPATAAAAAAGRIQGQGMFGAAQTMQPANAYSPWGAMLSGAGQAIGNYQTQQQQQQQQQFQNNLMNQLITGRV